MWFIMVMTDTQKIGNIASFAVCGGGSGVMARRCQTVGENGGKESEMAGNDAGRVLLACFHVHATLWYRRAVDTEVVGMQILDIRMIKQQHSNLRNT